MIKFAGQNKTGMKPSSKIRMLIATFAIMAGALTLFLIFPPNLTGMSVVSNPSWEHQIEVQATSDQQYITQHIIFDQNKPLASNCADGIYIEANGQSIPFKTENDSIADNLCAETDIVLDNIIYSPPENTTQPSFGITNTQNITGITYEIYYGKISTEILPPIEEHPKEPIVNESALEQQPIFETQGICGASITDCCNITTSNTYTLITDLVGIQTNWNACIDIQADNVVLDCADHSINYDDSSIGIYAQNHNNIYIHNCVITDYNQAISLNNVANSIIANNIANNSAKGIYFVSSSHNNLINNIANNNSISIHLEDDSSYNNLTNNTANLNHVGIYFTVSANYNNLTNNTANNNTVGVDLNIVSSNILADNILSNNTDGIDIVGGSSNNIITNNIVENNTLWDFYSDEDSLNNIVTNLDMGSTIVSFTSKDISLKNGTSPGGEPLLNISKYVNATNNSEDSWLFLNVSYIDPGDLGGVDESTLKISKYNNTGGGTWYTQTSTFANAYGVNAAEDYVYANITSFGSIFAPLSSAITNCVNITVPGSYTLANDLTGVQQPGVIDWCIYVQVNNTVLDCQGHSLNHDDSLNTYGIIVNYRDNDTINNCTITNYGTGIAFGSSPTTNSTIANSIINDNAIGISMAIGANHDNITNNTFNDNSQDGIFMSAGNNNIFINNTATNNGNDGVYLAYSTNNSFANNTFTENVYGVRIDDSPATNNSFTGNTINSNDYGLWLKTSSRDYFISNTISNNKLDGIYIETVTNSTFTNNSVENNVRWAFYSKTNSRDNNVTNLDIGDVNVSFKFKDIALTNATDPGGEPPGYWNINKFVNATNTSAVKWLYLNVSYAIGDLGGRDESTLAIAKNNATDWYTDPSIFASSYGVDTGDNYVYANITNFGSIFAPLGPSPLCILTVLINGVETENFTDAGAPVNVTVNVTDDAWLPLDANVQAHEYNGYTFFVMPQFQDSNVANDVYANISIGIDGIESFTLIPTGARYVDKTIVGDYNITVLADTGAGICKKTLYVTNTAFPEPSGSAISIPNRGQVDSLKTEDLRIYDKVKGWLALGGGEQEVVVMNAQTYDIELFQAVAGKPYAVDLSLNGGDGENYNVDVTETNGYPPFALPQIADSNNNVTSIAGAYFTDKALDSHSVVTIIPTGGRYFSSDIPYAINITMYNSTDTIASGYVTVTDKDFPEPSGAQDPISNQGNIDSFKTEILRIYDRIKGWLAL